MLFKYFLTTMVMFENSSVNSVTTEVKKGYSNNLLSFYFEGQTKCIAAVFVSL